MIIPIHVLKRHKFKQPRIGDEVILIKERENLFDPLVIAAYNKFNQQMGYISAQSNPNENVYKRMLEESVKGSVWSIGKNKILVEIDLPKF